MTPIATDGRLSLLWRTILLLSLCVIVTQIFLYIWIQRSVNDHFEQMDAEILTHAAFNLRQYMDSNHIGDTMNTGNTGDINNITTTDADSKKKYYFLSRRSLYRTLASTMKSKPSLPTITGKSLLVCPQVLSINRVMMVPLKICGKNIMSSRLI